MPSVANLVEGRGTLYIAPASEPLPEINDLTPPAIVIATPAGNWLPTGFTIEAHEFPYDVEKQDEEVGESNCIINTYIVKEGARFRIKFKERDATSMNLAMAASTLTTVVAGADQVAQDILSVGDGAVAEKSLLYLHTSPEGGSAIVHMPRVKAVGGMQLDFDKGQTSPYDVEFTILGDWAQAAGQRLFRVYHITAPATT